MYLLKYVLVLIFHLITKFTKRTINLKKKMKSNIASDDLFRITHSYYSFFTITVIDPCKR